MTDQEIIAILDTTGHLDAPFGVPRDTTAIDKTTLTLNDDFTKEAVSSYQSLYAPNLEPLIAAHYPERAMAAVVPDGVVGPATEELFLQGRCMHPDYPIIAAATGTGNWKSCYGIGQFHSAVVKVVTTIPPFLQSSWETVWDRVVESYAELGLLFKRDDNATHPNITISFVKPDGGWIGLAIVGQGQTCGDTIWARFDKNYQPANIVSEWTSLVKHELGHNCGLSHSSGGVMNSYIVKGLPVSWKGDPSYKLLVSRFGGQPVPTSPKERQMVIAWQYPDGHFDVIQPIQVPAQGGQSSFWPQG